MTLQFTTKTRSLSSPYLADLMTRINQLEEAARAKNAQMQPSSVVATANYLHVYDDLSGWVIFDVDAETVVGTYLWAGFSTSGMSERLIGWGPNDNIWTWGEKVVSGSPPQHKIRLNEYNGDTGAHVQELVCGGFDQYDGGGGLSAEDGQVYDVTVGASDGSYIFAVEQVVFNDSPVNPGVTNIDVTHRLNINGTYDTDVRTVFSRYDGPIWGDKRDGVDHFHRTFIDENGTVPVRWIEYDEDGVHVQDWTPLSYDFGTFKPETDQRRHEVSQTKQGWISVNGKTVKPDLTVVSDISISDTNSAIWPQNSKDELYVVPNNPASPEDIDIYTVSTGTLSRTIEPWQWTAYVMTQWYLYKWDVTSNIIIGATNASPIVIHAPDHQRETGDSVTNQGVRGNTAANATWTITKVDDDHFSLDGSTGDGDYDFNGIWTLGDSHELVGTKPGSTDFEEFSDLTPYRIHSGTMRDMLNAIENICVLYENSVTGNPWEPPGSTPFDSGDNLYHEKVDDASGDWLQTLGNVDQYNRMFDWPGRIFGEIEACIVALENSSLVTPVGS